MAQRPEDATEREAQHHARMYLEDVLLAEWPVITDNDRELNKYEQERLMHDLFRYRQHEPIQYITGKASFYGLMLQVNPAVLIPRQETEELVHLILKDHSEPYARVLDIGTGSGCIAIALQHHRPVWYMEAVDISKDALQLAELNARTYKAEVTFLQANVLSEVLFSPIPFDIIVSNPPYIPLQEKEKVGTSTQQYEPGLALWVPDDDPLLFYRVIAEQAKRLLKPGGHLYFECNEFYAEALSSMLASQGFRQIAMHIDLMDKPRMVRATL